MQSRQNWRAVGEVYQDERSGTQPSLVYQVTLSKDYPARETSRKQIVITTDKVELPYV